MENDVTTQAQQTTDGAQQADNRQAEPHGQPAEGSQPDYKALYEQLKADSRKWEDRAKSNVEKAKAYDALQAQAQAQMDANKTLEQQVADIRDQLNASNAANLRMKVANEKGVDERFLVGATEEELRSSADALLAWREQTAPKQVAPIVSAEGKTPENIGGQTQLGQFAHSFFGGN